MNQPLFSVIVPTFNRPSILQRTLDCLENQQCNFPFEVIVIDDHPVNVLPDLVFGKGKRENWKLIRNGWNLGRAATRNRGIQTATGQYILFIDDDIWSEPQLLQAHYDKQKEIGGGVVVGAIPPFINTEKSIWNEYGCRRYKRLLIYMEKNENNLPYFYLFTGNCSVPLKKIQEIGGFDESFKFYSYEDSELGLRLCKIGLKIYYAKTAVGHHCFSENYQSFANKAFQLGRSTYIFSQLHPDYISNHQYSTFLASPWKGTGMAKNIFKIFLFNPFTMCLLNSLIEIIQAHNISHKLMLLLLPWLEVQFRHSGFIYEKRRTK